MVDYCKERDLELTRSRACKKYEKPATPYERLLANDRVTSQCKDTVRQMFAVLDPVCLLSEIREAQQNLTQLEVGGGAVNTPEAAQDLNRFVKSLSTLWVDNTRIGAMLLSVQVSG